MYDQIPARHCQSFKFLRALNCHGHIEIVGPTGIEGIQLILSTHSFEFSSPVLAEGSEHRLESHFGTITVSLGRGFGEPPSAAVRIISATDPDGHSARVAIAATWIPPIGGALLPISVPLQVMATARTAFRQLSGTWAEAGISAPSNSTFQRQVVRAHPPSRLRARASRLR